MGSFRNITHILYDNSLKHNLCYLRNILLDVPVAGSDGILHFSLRYVGSVSRFFFIHFLKSVVSKSCRPQATVHCCTLCNFESGNPLCPFNKVII